MIFLILALTLSGIFLYRLLREPRRLSNGVYLIFALMLTALWAMTGDTATPLPALVGLLVLASPLLVLALAGFLLTNGVVMVRREGVSAANMLSFLAGSLLLALPVGAALAIASGSPVLTVAALSLTLASTYAGFAFTCFLLYAWVYSRLPVRRGHGAIIVLGAGLLDGEIPPLLANRLDRALALYERERKAGHRPVIVPSGGQGDDEPMPEAHAMARYLTSRGITPAELLPETRSTSTDENLRYSNHELTAAGVQGRLLVVTSNYHVLRAAILSRHLGLRAHVTGAPTARYYLPSAFLREFAALMVQYRALNFTACVVLLAVPPLLYLVGEALHTAW
ncbi:YdcF family protein [Hoyosella altamirensis]|uniref:Uncharacterized SAM-binding protein YcdF (DUF218 family) n=1 Tax=Hoyosella altamirensis TaxID=616997 RepID=A0A839RLE6_9ACTN|nr:YdcF family protein [Hoyosella altamirensis]MBB3037207.1 uncharacterized SAM-binding protein YcdF (DUF218 family) [Hoyosella altamirensis]